MIHINRIKYESNLSNKTSYEINDMISVVLIRMINVSCSLIYRIIIKIYHIQLDFSFQTHSFARLFLFNHVKLVEP